jgi:hypothetical protein
MIAAFLNLVGGLSEADFALDGEKIVSDSESGSESPPTINPKIGGYTESAAGTFGLELPNDRFRATGVADSVFLHEPVERNGHVAVEAEERLGGHADGLQTIHAVGQEDRFERDLS